ncbi:hypothetical protein GCM10020295_52980 [Streptomyces cinereospinus]
MRVVLGEVVGDTGHARVHLAAAELLGGDDLAGGGLHQRGAAEKDRPLAAHDDGLVAHRRDVRPAGRAGAEDGGDLRDAGGRHPGLVVEDPPEVLPVREDLVLHRQEGAAGVDEVEAGQPVLQRDLLGAQVLLHRHRVVRPALDGRVVGDDDALPPAHPPDAGDDAGGGRLAVVHPVGRERGQLQEGRAGVEQGVDPVTRQQFAARGVPGPRLLPPPSRAAASLARSSATSVRCASSLTRQAFDAGSAAPCSSGAWSILRSPHLVNER